MSPNDNEEPRERLFMQYNASDNVNDFGYVDVDTVVAIQPEPYGCLIHLCTPPHMIRSYYGVKTQMLYLARAMTLNEIYENICGEVINNGHLD